MNIREINTIIHHQLTGNISDEEEAMLKQWLNEDEEHRRLFQEIISRKDLVERYEVYDSIDDEAAWQKFEEQHTEKRPYHFGNLLKYAAILLVIIGGVAIYMNREKKYVYTPPKLSEDVQTAMRQAKESGRNVATIEAMPKTTSIAKDGYQVEKAEDISSEEPLYRELENEAWLEDAQRITTYYDKEFWLTLDDGTIVHLNYNTRLIYPPKFHGDTRNVILNGDAYFMVAHNDNHPFIVHTDDGDIKVYGTEFAVETQETGGATDVVLINGSVGVTPKKGIEKMMTPNQKCTMENGQCSMKEIDTYSYIAWNTGSFSFDNTSLERVMTVMSRWYNVKINFANDKIKQEKIYGDFDRYESLENVISAIEKSTGVRIERKDNILTINK